MRLLPINTVRSGMKLGKSIYSEDGRVLLGEHVELSDRLIKRLADFGISYLYVEDPRTDDISVEEIISDETRIKALSQIRSSFRNIMENSTRKRTGTEQLGKVFGDVLKMIIDDISSHKEAMVILSNISISDQYLFHHSLNVCIYSTILGISHGYNKEQLNILGLGALLHDVGKLRISQEILYKPGKLSELEFAEIRRHTELGFDMLRKESTIPLLSAHCALQHHERLDGSGYPRGLSGDQIHDFGKLIGLVDVYDAMTSHRVYRPAMLPHQAMETLFAGSGTLFNQQFIEIFRDKIATYPIGLTVRLNSGESAVVVKIHAFCPYRPVVRVLNDAQGQPLKQPYEIDLAEKLSVMINGIEDAQPIELV